MIFKQINVKSEKRNHFIDITDDIAKVVISENIKNGIIKLFVPHTTAGVTINEGFDPAVTKDLDKILSSISPYSSSYLHSEGNKLAPKLLLGSVYLLIVCVFLFFMHSQAGAWERSW